MTQNYAANLGAKKAYFYCFAGVKLGYIPQTKVTLCYFLITLKLEAPLSDFLKLFLQPTWSLFTVTMDHHQGLSSDSGEHMKAPNINVDVYTDTRQEPPPLPVAPAIGPIFFFF